MTAAQYVLGKYQIIEEIGRGGMGVVYKAKDVRIERIVAIKELLINPALIKEKDEIIARFHREARTAGSLQHPNIVTIHDFGGEDDRHFIAMEYLEGRNLKDFMDDGLPFSSDQLLDILAQICEGLQHAHDNGVVHRDIKPDNISIMPNGTVKITDFGIARMSSNSMVKMTQDGTMLGTLGYISPEQLQDSRSVDNRTDIFSLGAMMYELYAGKLPFDGGNVGATILKILTEEPVPVIQLNPKIDPEIDRIIMKALQKDPNKRFQQVREIADLIRQLKRKGKGNDNQGVMVACPSCQSPVATNSKFCNNCGTPMAQGQGPSAQPARSAAIQGAFAAQSAPPPAAPTDKKEGSFKDRLNQLAQITNIYQKKDKDTLPPSTPARDELKPLPTALPKRPPITLPSRTESPSSRSAPPPLPPPPTSITGPLGGGAPAPPVSIQFPSGRTEIGASTAGGTGPLSMAIKRLSFVRKIGQVGAGKGQFSQPRGMTVSQGLIFVADTQNQRVQVFSKFGDWQYLIRPSSEKEALKYPCCIGVDRQSCVYVVDAGTSRVSLFDQSGRFIRSFGSAGKAKGEFMNPYGVAISKNHEEIYVADTENSRIQVMDSNGQVLKIFGRHGTRAGEFKSPYAIALDDKDNLYILDYAIPRIQVLDRHGICRLEFGRRGIREGEFSIPRGLAVDARGRIYVADTLNHRIQIFDPKGEWLYSFGSKGRGDGEFWGPESISVSEDGEIFVLDKGNSRIQVLAEQQ